MIHELTASSRAAVEVKALKFCACAGAGESRGPACAHEAGAASGNGGGLTGDSSQAPVVLLPKSRTDPLNLLPKCLA